MTQVSAQLVKELREKSGAGMMDCKKALVESSGDLEKAMELLRKQGLKKVDKRADKVAAEGAVLSYVHPGGRVGVLLELNCETDFVARGDDFQELARAIAMHIAWAAPKYLEREQVPAAEIEKEKEIFLGQLKPEQEKMADKIIAGKMEKFFEESCLLEQIDARETEGKKKKIVDVVNDVSAALGEKIAVRRFARYELGEGIEKAETDYREEVAAAARAAS